MLSRTTPDVEIARVRAIDMAAFEARQRPDGSERMIASPFAFLCQLLIVQIDVADISHMVLLLDQTKLNTFAGFAIWNARAFPIALAPT
jgi:hypothetical protein